MTKFYDAYKAVFDAVKTAVSKKTSIKTVLLGVQYSHGRLPKALINAEPSPVAPLEMGDTLEIKINVSIVLLILEYEPKNWFTDVIPIMGDVVDAILADRTLGGSAKDCILTNFAPGEIKFEELKDKVFYGGTVNFQAVLWFAP